MDAGSEGYYTYYYVSFTKQERQQLKELFGRDLFAKGYTDCSACQTTYYDITKCGLCQRSF